MPITLVPLLLADMQKPPCPLETGVLQLYARNGALRLLNSDCKEWDVVLDRKLEGYRKLSKYSALSVNDTLRTALAKLEAGLQTLPAQTATVVSLRFSEAMGLLTTKTVVAGALYCILDFPKREGVLYLHGLSEQLFTSTGWYYDTQALFVTIDLVAQTLTPFEVALPPSRNIDEVPTKKALAVIQANKAALIETDSSYDGKSFFDDRDPASIIFYSCRKSRTLVPAKTPIYKWFRIPVL